MKLTTALCCPLLLCLLIVPPAEAQLGTAFTFQGRLESTSPGNPGQGGRVDLRFSLFDAPTGGQPVGSPVFVDDVEIAGGWFSVELDFGAVFDGTPLWMEIARSQGRGQNTSYAPVGTRIPILATPYAQYSIAAGWAAEADHALEADHAVEANHAAEADHALDADRALQADEALEADRATEADHADEADHALRADRASEADRALAADHAASADSARNADTLDSLDSSAFLRVTGGTIQGNLAVAGEARAARFVGDGSGLTNLPSPPNPLAGRRCEPGAHVAGFTAAGELICECAPGFLKIDGACRTPPAGEYSYSVSQYGGCAGAGMEVRLERRYGVRGYEYRATYRFRSDYAWQPDSTTSSWFTEPTSFEWAFGRDNPWFRVTPGDEQVTFTRGDCKGGSTARRGFLEWTLSPEDFE